MLAASLRLHVDCIPARLLQTPCFCLARLHSLCPSLHVADAYASSASACCPSCTSYTLALCLFSCAMVPVPCSLCDVILRARLFCPLYLPLYALYFDMLRASVCSYASCTPVFLYTSCALVPAICLRSVSCVVCIVRADPFYPLCIPCIHCVDCLIDYLACCFICLAVCLMS